MYFYKKNFMKYIIPLLLVVFLLTSFDIKDSSNETQNFVYTCSNPSLKCFYKFPCSDFFRDCNQNKGKVMKVTLERAKSLGKEECSCSRE